MQLSLFGDEPAVVIEGIKCIKCLELKPFEEFGNASGGKYKNTTCRKCSNKNARTIRDLYETTSLPPEDHCCPICLRKKEDLICPTKPNKSVWSLDHDHRTGKFRGWLCHRCNRGIGLIGDSVDNAERVLSYLMEEL